jgi:mono/diheme cytochrome c family protein
MCQTRAIKSPGKFRALPRTALACLIVAAGAPASSQAASEERGTLLYDTHCIACHTTEAHWRDKKLARNWKGLLEQVTIWQANANLGWSEQDIEAVSVLLNRRYYRFPPPVGY